MIRVFVYVSDDDDVDDKLDQTATLHKKNLVCTYAQSE